MFVFGVVAFLAGALGIISPITANKVNNFPDATDYHGPHWKLLEPISRSVISLARASNMAAFNMGAYYILSSIYNIRAFFVWTVPFRCVTFSVFMYGAYTDSHTQLATIAVMELIGAIATGVGLYVDAKSQRKKVTQKQ
jgi:hypothetical protein